MNVAGIAQRVGTALAHSLLSQARYPIEVEYQSSEGIDFDQSLCSVFYIHMTGLKNLVNVQMELWIAVKYTLKNNGEQEIGFTVTHDKVEACEVKAYPLFSIAYATKLIQEFFAYSLLPYFDTAGKAQNVDINYLTQKYGGAEAWGDTVVLHLDAKDFPHDVDYNRGVFRGFSNRLWQDMSQDVIKTMRINEDLRHRVFVNEDKIGVAFLPMSTYEASKDVPKQL